MPLNAYRMNTSIAVTDMPRAEEFYERTLGLVAERTGADGSKMYASGGRSPSTSTRLPITPASPPRPWRRGTSTTSSRWSTS